MDAKIRAGITELVGTYLVVLVGAGTLCATYLTETSPGTRVLAVALAEGFTLAAVVTMTGHLSPACCNPALTLTLWVTKQLDLNRALLLGGAQFAGAFLAGLSLRLTFSDVVLSNARLGTPHLGAFGDTAPTLAMLAAGVSLEAVFTFLVAIAAYASLIDPRGTRLGGLYVGLAQSAVILFGFHLTGGAANPARWFGPALWQLSVADIPRPFAEHAVYWAGPVLGALAGCVFYSAVLQPPEKK
jgi:glycerol uptake facilitator-like aquaporin